MRTALLARLREAGAVIAFVLVPASASADEPDPFVAFPTTTPHDGHFVRAGLEIGGVITVGFVDYLLNTNARGGVLRTGESKWDLRYDADTFRGKFTGSSYAWDTNRFGTNFGSHPFAGTLYFTAARSNHLSFVEATAYAVVASSIWEYFGEIRETNSVNDMFVTPLAGTAIGETMMQLAGFFDRSAPGLRNSALSLFLAPWKTINDATDDVETVRTKAPDRFGLATEPWHRFAFEAGGGLTRQSSTTADVHFGMHLDVANLPGYAGVGHWSRTFRDGNRAGLAIETTHSRGQLVDARFSTRILPAGLYVRDVDIAPDGRLRGDGLLVGLRMSFDYEMHDYDRDRARPTDLDCIVSPLGIAAEYVLERGGLHVKTALDIGGGLAGVASYALSDWERRRARAGLPSVVREQGYDYSLAVSVEPSVALRLYDFEWTSSFRLDSFRGVLSMDQDPSTVDASIGLSDRRTRLRTTLAWQPGVPRIALTLGSESRSGEIGPLRASRTESSILATTGLVF